MAKLCLKHKKLMATTSYISPEMKAMAADVEAAGLTFINECGVDPGLDHMSAMRVIHEATAKGGKVEAFRSYCGGLPAPEANTNPIGYKFSWAPRGVLTAAGNPSRFRQDGKIVEIPGDELFRKPEIVEIPGLGTFEGFPNRDAMPYAEMYGLESAATMFRGTLRNMGHCETWYQWIHLGLFDQTIRPELVGKTYRDFMCAISGDEDPKRGLAKKTGLPQGCAVYRKAGLAGVCSSRIPSPWRSAVTSM